MQMPPTRSGVIAVGCHINEIRMLSTSANVLATDMVVAVV
jgi:hypothetical protein